MNKKSVIAFIITCVIWVTSLLFSVMFLKTSGGYSIFVLILLPISLLVYLGNYYGREDEKKSIPEKDKQEK